MSNQVDAAIRSREAFNLARAALNQMEKAQIWPTPLNFELWLHLICEPDGAIAQEIARLMSLGAVLTDAMAEELAKLHKERRRHQLLLQKGKVDAGHHHHHHHKRQESASASEKGSDASSSSGDDDGSGNEGERSKKRKRSSSSKKESKDKRRSKKERKEKERRKEKKEKRETKISKVGRGAGSTAVRQGRVFVRARFEHSLFVSGRLPARPRGHWGKSTASTASSARQTCTPSAPSSSCGRWRCAGQQRGVFALKRRTLQNA